MIEITFTSDPLPSDFKGSLEDFRQRFLTNLRGKISETQVLTGQVGGARPVENIGPWLNTDCWFIWNGMDYVPSTIKVGGAEYQVTLSNEFAGTTQIVPDKIQMLQDKTGTIALTTDVYEGRPTVIMFYDPAGVATIDWNAGHHFFLLLASATTVKSINSKDGQQVTVAFRNGATPYGVTWPTYFAWPNTTPPAQSGANKTDVYILKNIGGSVIARQIPNYP